ncbi:MAG: glycosyltransferase family 2 protein [Pirellulaceae bacterium]|nr:glycosyltransferase family 2 protein [Pirellulaceae bacterium]
MSPSVLIALPVYNEKGHLHEVLDQVVPYGTVLVVDDGSEDGTADLLRMRTDISVVTHEVNRGYGAALKTAFKYALSHQFDLLVTIDCDGQHEPQRIPEFVAACTSGVDIVSGSRYLKTLEGNSTPPIERQKVNIQITEELNERLGLELTDAFCGFKVYRTEALKSLCLQETGYGMPLELWVKAAFAKLTIIERPVPLIYLDEKRSFGDLLDNSQRRLDYYHEVIDRSLMECSFQAETPCSLLRLANSKTDPCVPLCPEN